MHSQQSNCVFVLIASHINLSIFNLMYKQINFLMNEQVQKLDLRTPQQKDKLSLFHLVKSFTSSLRNKILSARKIVNSGQYITYQIIFPPGCKVISVNDKIWTQQGQYIQVKMSIWDLYPQVYSSQKNQYKIYYGYNKNNTEKDKQMTKHFNQHMKKKQNEKMPNPAIINFDPNYRFSQNIKNQKLLVTDAVGVIVAEQIRFNILLLEGTKLQLQADFSHKDHKIEALHLFNYLSQYKSNTYNKWGKNSEDPEKNPLPKNIENLVKKVTKKK